MKQVISFLICMMVSSCWFSGNRQEKSSELTDVIAAIEDEGMKPLEENMPVTTPAEEQTSSGVSREDNPDAWYDHDFSLVVVMHKYMSVSTPFPQADETVLVTRKDDKAYIQTSIQGVVQKCITFEPIPVGYRETIYKNGKVDWTHDFDNGTLNYQVGYRLRHDYMLAKDIPTAVDLANAQETTRCGRPAWEVEVEEEEDGSKSVSTFVIDQEYRFFYSVKQVGKNKYGHDVNITLFDVTSFTDKPTARDIPNPKNTVSPVEKMKRQLQNQLEAAGK